MSHNHCSNWLTFYYIIWSHWKRRQNASQMKRHMTKSCLLLFTTFYSLPFRLFVPSHPVLYSTDNHLLLDVLQGGASAKDITQEDTTLLATNCFSQSRFNAQLHYLYLCSLAYLQTMNLNLPSNFAPHPASRHFSLY